VNSIVFVAVLVMLFTLLSMLGVREQEASQLMANSSIVLYGITYVSLFALPVFGNAALRKALPGWLKAVSVAGLLASLISLFIAVYPIVDVVSKTAYAAKICSIVVIANMTGVLIYRAGQRKR
jgi:hypothetical protein